MPAIINLIQIYLVLSLMLYSVESAAPLSKRVIVQFTRPASGDLLAQQREGVPGDTLETDALQQKNDFISALKTTGLNGNLVHSYTKLINGVSFNLDNENDLNTLKTLPGVLEVFPVRTSSLDQLHSAHSLRLLSEEGGGQESDLFRQTGHTLTGVNIIHTQHPDINGKEVKVGIIDTGINYRNPALTIPGQTCEKFGGLGCRVLFGKDLVGDDYDGYNTPRPDNDPMDCHSHGTNVAGIIGGNSDEIKGVAQQVVFGAYRTSGCQGITSEDIVLAGLDVAFTDKMQVIILSEDFGMSENSDPISQMVDKMSQYGTIIISQAGNRGQRGYGTVVAPGAAKLGIAAASYDNVQSYGPFLSVNGVPGLDLVQFDIPGSISNDKQFEVGKSYNVIVSPQQNAELGDGCTAFQADSFKDGVALIIRSDLCSYSDMVDNAVNNGGAMGVIIYNSYPSLLDRALDATTLNFPTVFISGSEGMDIAKAAIKPGFVSVIIDYYWRQSQPVKSAGLPSTFSSMGLDLSLLMKPDLGAPGAYMITSGLGSDVHYNYGTGMAAAYLTGVAALEVQRSGNSTTFSAFQRRLHITAKPTMITGSALGEIAMSVAKIGAGLVDVPKFLFSSVDIEPSKLELGDENMAMTKTIKVTNTGRDSLTYRITHLPSDSFKAEGGVPQHLIENGHPIAEVDIPVKEITIASGHTVEFNVTITPTASFPHVIQSGFIKLDNPVDPNGTLTIPYVLMTGKYSDFPLIGSKNPPALYPASFIDDNRIPPFANTDKPTFNLKTRASSPAFIFDLIFPVRHMNVILVDTGSKKPVGLLWSCLYCQPFTKTKTEFVLESTISDLTDPTKKISVLNGTYKIVVQAVLPRPLTPVPNVNEALVTIEESILFIVDLSATLTSSVLTTTTATPTPTL